MSSHIEELAPFVVRTCETHANAPIHSLKPNNNSFFSPFEIYDPFGLRNAIVPVFRQDIDGRMYGMGTAFHVDGFGTFLTAYHVVDFVEHHLAGRPILFFSMHAVVFGTVNIPPDCFVPAMEVFASLTDADDPLALLKGKKTKRPAIDVASLLVSEIGPGVKAPQTLPVRISGWMPQLGEIVLAIGFPKLDLSEVNEHAQAQLLTEGMYGTYGRVVEIHPNGTSSSNSTPVFEVECDWAPGMSGGPVFNRDGDVVGLVSRSLRAEQGLAGAGFAVHFGMARDVELLAPVLDTVNPGWRRVWGVFVNEGGEPLSIHATRKEADQAAMVIGGVPKITYISSRIGTGDFCVLSV